MRCCVRKSVDTSEFLSCVDAGIAAICRMPEMYAAIHEQYRRRFVHRFPYAIFCEIRQAW
jgi:hypothetical protein